MKKEVIAHLKGDIKDFKKEASEDRALIKKLKGKSMKKKHVKKVSSKKKKSSKPGHAKFKKVIKEFKAGKLHSGSKKGPKVMKLSQARAIAFSEDRKADHTAKKPKRKKK